MAERSASNTAVGVALLRAAHLIIDAPPPVLADTVIGQLLGPDLEARIRDAADRLQSGPARGLRAHVLLRSRFAEACLADAVERHGVRQYILLGAGLDTFAYRQPDWAHNTTIIEVDQPASQADKRRRLREAAVAEPSNVRYVDIDFERESLADGLARHGVAADVPTFFSWLGVTMYLQKDAIDAVLETVARFPASSEIVLTFTQPVDPDGGSSVFAERAAESGEPWVSFFTPDELTATLRAAGLSGVEFLSRDEAAARYFANRADGLDAPRRVSIARAFVGAER